MSAGAFDPVAVARGFSDELRRRSDEFEAARQLPMDLVERMAEAGIYRLWVPECYGGLEVAPLPALRALEVLSAADAAVGWCVFIGVSSSTVLSALPETTAREVCASPTARMAGVYAPMGVAEAEPGGFRVTGRWPFGSGTQNADWILGGCRFMRDGEPILNGKGQPEIHMLLARAEEFEFLDTWHVSGLCGTGSTDFELKGAFVPESHVVGWGDVRPLDRPLYRFPIFTLLGMGFGAIALGIARAALDEFTALASGKQRSGDSRTLARRHEVQLAVGKSEAAWRSARAFYYEAVEAAWSESIEAGRVSLEKRRDVRLSACHAVESAVSIVDAVYHLGGGTSIYSKSRLQRHFRDIHVVTQHMMVRPTVFELAGSTYLGADRDVSSL